MSTLGENVTSAWPIALSSEANPGFMKATSGTSVATAIAASIGALLLDFVRQDHQVATLRWAAENLRTMDGMKVVLSDMAKRKGRFRYIEPFTYLDGSEDDSELGPFSRRESALNKIFHILRNEFEYKPIIDSLSTSAPGAVDGLGLISRSGGNFVPTTMLEREFYGTLEVRQSSTSMIRAPKRIHRDSITSGDIESKVMHEAQNRDTNQTTMSRLFGDVSQSFDDIIQRVNAFANKVDRFLDDANRSFDDKLQIMFGFGNQVSFFLKAGLVTIFTAIMYAMLKISFDRPLTYIDIWDGLFGMCVVGYYFFFAILVTHLIMSSLFWILKWLGVKLGVKLGILEDKRHSL